MALLKLSDQYAPERLEAACAKALFYTPRPSYKSIQTILKAGLDKPSEEPPAPPTDKFGFTRGADYYALSRSALAGRPDASASPASPECGRRPE